MDELDKMIAELGYKFLQEKGAEGGTLEEMMAYVLAAKNRDANLQAAAELACADEEAAKPIDEDSVLERRRYFTRLTGHIERDIQGCSITAPAEPQGEFVDRMLREMPPPASVTREDAVVRIFMNIAVMVLEQHVAEGDCPKRMRDLAAMHGCPEDVATLPWLAEHRLIRYDPEGGVYSFFLYN